MGYNFVIIMPHSYNRIWIHAIWATKKRAHFIHQNIEQKIYQLLSEQLEEQGCPVRIINGMPDHIHALFLLSPKKSIAGIIKQIKGSSSYYINLNNLIAEKFVWQTGYAAYSVSDSAVERVYVYIRNQKQHHKKITFDQEYEKYLTLNDQLTHSP